ncbi:hypothetical protein SCHPADRAFT_451123 [Schizopora paradoxa]|uniref:Uncharacterized protein n=1 Tax=Schizopora paradoxa TaxID=27342 RepID=A0A0H2RIY5_9AGAM|nr:hypothetical protein SCHPADRAFT_451123 [Schizopora paradoxa]
MNFFSFDSLLQLQFRRHRRSPQSDDVIQLRGAPRSFDCAGSSLLLTFTFTIFTFIYVTHLPNICPTSSIASTRVQTQISLENKDYESQWPQFLQRRRQRRRRGRGLGASRRRRRCASMRLRYCCLRSRSSWVRVGISSLV